MRHEVRVPPTWGSLHSERVFFEFRLLTRFAVLGNSAIRRIRLCISFWFLVPFWWSCSQLLFVILSVCSPCSGCKIMQFGVCGGVVRYRCCSRMASDICFVNICICKYISLKVFCRCITIQKGESLFFTKQQSIY